MDKTSKCNFRQSDHQLSRSGTFPGQVVEFDLFSAGMFEAWFAVGYDYVVDRGQNIAIPELGSL